MSFRIFAGAAVFACAALSAVNAHAATVILDTLNDNAEVGVSTDDGGLGADATPAFNIFEGVSGRPLGQSFELTEATNMLSVFAFFTSFSNGFDLTVSLFEGAGVGDAGDALGSVEFDIADAEVAGRLIASRMADFSFLGVLEAGIYTVAFESTGPDANSGALLGGDVGVNTLGTDSFDANGLFDFGSSLSQEFGVLVEGAAISEIPLPAALPLFLVGLGGLTAMRRRRAA